MIFYHDEVSCLLESQVNLAHNLLFLLIELINLLDLYASEVGRCGELS